MKRVLWFLALATILSSTPLSAQTGVITDNQGGYTTFQQDPMVPGQGTWQNSRGEFGYIQIQPPLGLSGGFGGGFLQGLQQSQNFYLRAQELKLQQDLARQQQKRMETEEQIQQLQLQLLQQKLTPSSPRSSLSAPPASTLSDEQIKYMAERQAVLDVIAEEEAKGRNMDDAKAVVMMVDEGLDRPRPRSGPCTPFKAWTEDHQRRWGSTALEANLAYIRSGHHNCQ